MKMEWVSLSTVIFPLFFSLSLSNPDFPILLTFKSSADQFESLSSWSNSSDPCSSWLGVQCHPSTRRVTRLVLDYLNLTGSIYPLTLLSHLRLLSLKHNRLSLSSPAATAAAALDLSSWPHLKHLYLSHNLFAGKFPSGAASLHRLRRLDLSHNYFFGHIPMTELTQLPHLITLRLEANSFTGTLNSDDPPPPSTLSVFNVSGNDLVGGIPEWLSWLPESSFSGNNHLCGKPLPNSCPHPIARKRSPDCMPSNPTTNKRNIHNRVVVMIVSIDAIAILAALVTVTWICHRCTRGRAAATQEKKGRLKRFDSAQREYINYGGVEQNRKMAFFDGCQGIAKVDDLLRASAEMLGMGYVGATYKVMMDGGDVVVVKRVRERLKRREADGLLRVIGGLRHNNIVSLRAFYHSKDELLLVYDFLPNGSLHSLLHGNRGPGRTPLDWTTRLKLASGAAKGLAFLHCYNKSKLFHGHCTSSNIIVDTLGNACVSDIGLRQLLPPPRSAHGCNALEPTPTIGNQKFSQKCDVYSFGVVLMEILTGKMATGEREIGLVKSAVREGRIWEVFDFELLRYKEMEEEMVALLRVALLCLNPSLGDRPKMAMVQEMIEEIRVKGGRGSGSNSPLNVVSSDSSPPDSESAPNFSSN